MLANPKAALGFAGVVIVIAIVASFGAGAFLPEPEQEEEPIAAVEPESGNVAQSAPAPAPAQQAAWGGGGLSDSWSSSASTPTAQAGERQGGATEGPNPTFGEYSASNGQQGPKTAQRSQKASNTGPKITSSAAPGAPPVKSGNADVPELVRQ